MSFSLAYDIHTEECSDLEWTSWWSFTKFVGLCQQQPGQGIKEHQQCDDFFFLTQNKLCSFHSFFSNSPSPTRCCIAQFNYDTNSLESFLRCFKLQWDLNHSKWLFYICWSGFYDFSLLFSYNVVNYIDFGYQTNWIYVANPNWLRCLIVLISHCYSHLYLEFSLCEVFYFRFNVF